MRKILFLIIFFAFANYNSANANQPLSCEKIYLDTKLKTEYGKLKYEKLIPMMDSHGKLKFTYSKELINQSPVKNQDNVGTCHMHAWASYLEHEAFSLYGKQIILSNKYLNAMHWYAESMNALFMANNNEKWEVQLGSDTITSQQLILLLGLMPQEAWTAGVDFQVGIKAKRLEAYVKNIIANAKFKIDSTTDQKKKIEIFNQADKDISKLFNNMVGSFSGNFNYEGTEYTTTSFLQKYFPFANQRQVYMQVAENPEAKTAVFETKNSTVVQTDVSTIENTIKKLIDAGHDVILSYNHDNNFVDNNTGIMSLSLFNYPRLAAPLNRMQRKAFNFAENPHAVVIVGYDLNPKTGKISRFKLKNSWGTEIGDQGYFHMYRDFFRTNVLNIIFAASDNIPLPTNKAPAEPTQYELDLK